MCLSRFPRYRCVKTYNSVIKLHIKLNIYVNKSLLGLDEYRLTGVAIMLYFDDFRCSYSSRTRLLLFNHSWRLFYSYRRKYCDDHDIHFVIYSYLSICIDWENILFCRSEKHFMVILLHYNISCNLYNFILLYMYVYFYLDTVRLDD